MTLESRLLEALSQWRQASAWRVAFSGGLDSTVLLHALVKLAERHRLPLISAIHIHHGLQPAADAWPEHCRQFCAKLGVPLQIMQVQVRPGASLEQAAREARYAAFASSLTDGELLLTAQHRDDQTETLLFRLMRGAGVRGLAAMPESRTLGAGRLLRPLLTVARSELESWALEHQLQWVEDPSNQSIEHSRNFLRHQVMPVLEQRWPQASGNMARAAAHLGEAQSLLDELAGMDLKDAQGSPEWPWLPLPSLDLSMLRALSPARQRNALRHWLSPLTRLPDTDHWAGWQALRDAAEAATPCWRLAGGELHRAGNRLWWLSGPWLEPVAGELAWPDTAAALSLPANGSVSLEGAGPGAYRVGYRKGGEVMRLPGRGRRDLKRLFNESAVPGFLRSRWPLLYCEGELIAVANLPYLNVTAASFVWTPPA
ncbi:tRNA lysidine(34) synthetase TilS [Pseudomonas saudiphocaensis]|uniref:tRNA lysidine(34) synthetase TilS n=1 Tax=Pseudomonas saudiphocaensis TaxID=1499686 RepID=UPI000F76AE15|nr:tRNA lysidine(34) synthetase TilS [Pseudomonas saudiphocaensis]RRV15087.1 tRNA lysidine(34) synthetase TilS [Pseudomonas saudiphocaensis]